MAADIVFPNTSDSKTLAAFIAWQLTSQVVASVTGGAGLDPERKYEAGRDYFEKLYPHIHHVLEGAIKTER